MIPTVSPSATLKPRPHHAGSPTTPSHTETLIHEGVPIKANGSPWCWLCMGEKTGIQCKATRCSTYSKNVHIDRPTRQARSHSEPVRPVRWLILTAVSV